MDERRLKIENQELVVHPQRALSWPDARCAFVADVHLGKSQHFRDHGAAVPEDLLDSLNRLTRVVEETDSDDLFILGDFVHTSRAITPTIENAVLTWIGDLDARVTIIMGNHDRGMGATFRRWGMSASSEPLEVGPFELAHEPGPSSLFRIAGHVHPTFVMRAGADRIRLPCLWVGRHYALLPAFSSFTSGLKQRRKDAEIFVFFDDDVRRL